VSPVRAPDVVHSASVRIAIRTGAGAGTGTASTGFGSASGNAATASPDSTMISASNASTNVGTAASHSNQFAQPDDADGTVRTACALGTNELCPIIHSLTD
jgi:hypothetical protein